MNNLLRLMHAYSYNSYNRKLLTLTLDTMGAAPGTTGDTWRLATVTTPIRITLSGLGAAANLWGLIASVVWMQTVNPSAPLLHKLVPFLALVVNTALFMYHFRQVILLRMKAHYYLFSALASTCMLAMMELNADILTDRNVPPDGKGALDVLLKGNETFLNCGVKMIKDKQITHHHFCQFLDSYMALQHCLAKLTGQEEKFKEVARTQHGAVLDMMKNDKDFHDVEDELTTEAK